MVVLANRHRSPNSGPWGPSPSTVRDTSPANTRLATKLQSGSFLPSDMRSDLPPDTLRTLSLSLTLSRWTPLAPQAPLGNTLSDSRNSLLTSRISGSHSRLITSAPTPLSPSPLTPFDSEIRDNSVARTRHATDRFPRFTYLLLRNGTLQSESDEGRSRRSADPEGTRASLWPLPVAPTQCGIRDETGLQSCAAASGSGTCSLAEHSSSPSRASITSASDPVEPLASALESDQLWLLPVVSPSGKAAMSTYPGTTSSSSRGNTRTGNEQQQVLAPTPTRRGPDRIAGERITPGDTHLGYTSQSQTPNSAGGDDDADADDYDQQGQEGGPGDGQQPKKKKTRRAGVAITRARRMQREVRRLAEEEEATPQRQPQPVRSLLLPASVHHGVHHQGGLPSPTHGGPSAAELSRQLQGLSLGGSTSPRPRAMPGSPASAGVSPPGRRPARSESTPPGASGPHAAHPRGPGVDRILEDGGDVVLFPGLPGAGRAPGSNIWAYRPEDWQRPRGGA